MNEVLGYLRPSIHVDSHVLRTEQHSPIQRILAFLNLSIDDVINDPIARTKVYYHFRIYNLIGRRCRAVDSERRQHRIARGLAIITDE